MELLASFDCSGESSHYSEGRVSMGVCNKKLQYHLQIPLFVSKYIS